MVLNIVNKPTSTENSSNPTDDRLARIKGEVVSLLEDKLEELRRESEKLKGTMEQALYRISAQGFDAKLDDLRSGRWHRVASEVKALQDVVAIIDSHE